MWLSKELILELKQTPEFKNGNFNPSFPIMILCNHKKEAEQFAINQGWPNEENRIGIWGRTHGEGFTGLSNEYILIIDLRKHIEDRAWMESYEEL